MTVLFSADFAAALDLTTLWSDEASPQVWSTSGGLLLCSTGNQRILNTRTGAHAALLDVLVTARRSSGTNFDGCVIARSNVSGTTSAAGNCYFLNVSGTNVVQFFRRAAGTNNQVGANITTTTVNSGDTFGLKVTGNGATVTLVAYVNGVQIGTEPDTAGSRIVVAGQTGIFGFNATSRYDDFSVDDLSTGGSVIVRAQGGLDGGMSSYTGGMR